MTKVITLLISWLLDLWLGDPSWLPHPVVGFGKMIASGEHRLNKGSHRMLKGALLAIGLILLVFGFVWVIRRLLGIFAVFIFDGTHQQVYQLPVFLWIFDVTAIFCCLAGTTLIREVREVFHAVDRSLKEGRKQVARIVGRDTSELSAQEVRTAALETLAENLSDGVIAPLFWLAIGGVPAMVAYKMVNTLDSMIGYRTERYKDFGCWAAHIDDVANYIPARITALLMIISEELRVKNRLPLDVAIFSVSSVATDECMLRPIAAILRLLWLASSTVVLEALTTISENYSTSPILARMPVS